MLRFNSHRLLLLVFLLFNFVSAPVLHADPIALSILNPDRAGAAGDVITFTGTITNNTGMELTATDFFINFAGYDPINVTLDQILGSTSFNIADSTTTGLLDLFSFTLAAAIPNGIYSADVILQTAAGDVAATETVNVTVGTVPEPDTWLLLLTGAATAGFARIKKRRNLAAFFLLASAANAGIAATTPVNFVTNPPGIAMPANKLLIALPIVNNGTATANNVKITAATLRSATLSAPSSFPVTLGTVAPGAINTFQADFDASALAQNTNYLLTVRGTYQLGTTTSGFTVNRNIVIPRASTGSTNLGTGSVDPNTVTGGLYPPQTIQFGEADNVPRPPIPSGPFVSGTPTPFSTGPANLNSLGAAVTTRAAARVVFKLNQNEGNTSAGTNCSPGTPPAACAEPSGASSGGGIVFTTANWSAAYSTDGGSTFTQLNPTTIFPADAIGFCCDQVVQYVPSIDRFIWLLQGGGGMRIASASPAQIKSSGGTAWTYWNLGPATFGQPAGTGFDYPDMSVGSNNLYLSWDNGFPNCPKGCSGGLEVVRIPLSQIQSGGTIFFDYTTPSDSSTAWGSHLTQDTGNEIFWAGHNGNSKLRVFSLAEGSNTYYWRDVDVSTWPNNTLSAKTPDNQDWLAFGFPGNSVIGATRSGNGLWFAWTAGTNDSFKQPHVEMVTLDRANNFNKTQQVQVWNSDFAFAYPALATNDCTGEIGMSLVIGGNSKYYQNHAVGFWGDYLVYQTTNSGSGVNRFGDYLTIRQSNSYGMFDAFGYGISTVDGVMKSDVRYVIFGRNCFFGIRG